MDKLTLTAQVRESKGKGAARKLRKQKQIPAVLYGSNTEPIMLSVEFAEFDRIIRKTSVENVLLGLEIKSGEEKSVRTVMIKELQTDPIRDFYLHADFHEIEMDKKLTVNIPVHLINTPIGVTEGGILQHIRRELSVSCFPDKLIEYIEADVSTLDIGDALHVKDIEFPEDIRSLDEGHLTVAVVAAPKVVEEEEVVVEEAEAEEGVAEEEAAEPEETPAEES